jgi:hypothetical protein
MAASLIPEWALSRWLPVLVIAAWSASSCSEPRDLTIKVCYRLGADGPLGRRSPFWYR